MKKIQSNDAPVAIGPYSQGIQVGNLFFFSGQIALNPATGELENENFEGEVRQVMSNLSALLKDAGLSFSNVVKMNISLTDLGRFAEFNEIYSEYLSEPYPARACVGVSALPRGSQVEVEMIASL